ncbi:MAG: c-type cytochrome domain-containing protein, partial [Planctomycetota bacterium]
MRQLSSLILVGALVTACGGSSGDDGGNGNPPPTTVSYSQDLVPIFQVDCLRCHGAGMAGGLDLLTHQGLMAGGQSGPVVIPFDPDNSL